MKANQTYINFDILAEGTEKGKWYVEHPDSDQAIFQNDFKYSLNLWDKFCVWFYPKFFHCGYIINKKNIRKNLSVRFSIISDLNNDFHYIGQVWITNKK